MFKLKISKSAQKEILTLSKKYARQVVARIDALRLDPEGNDTKMLKGYPLRRADVGEYRIIYYFLEEKVYIEVVGKRNDSEVYRRLKRKWS